MQIWFILLCAFMKSNNKQSTVGKPICEVLEEMLAVQYIIYVIEFVGH